MHHSADSAVAARETVPWHLTKSLRAEEAERKKRGASRTKKKSPQANITEQSEIKGFHAQMFPAVPRYMIHHGGCARFEPLFLPRSHVSNVVT